MQTPEEYIKQQVRSAPDDFGAYYDPARKTKQVWKWEKFEKLAESQNGSNSASFFLARRAKFLDHDRLDKLKKEDEEKRKLIEAKQIAAANKAETDRKLQKNRLKRQKKKERKEKYEKRQNGQLPPVSAKKIVRDESAVKAVADSIRLQNELVAF